MWVWVSHKLDGGVETLLTETQRAESWTTMLSVDTVHSRWPTSMMPKNMVSMMGGPRAVAIAAEPMRSRRSATSRRVIPEVRAIRRHGMAACLTERERWRWLGSSGRLPGTDIGN